MKKAFCFVMLCAGVLLLSSCKREISITYEQPLEQKDYRLFFLGLSTDITEMPTNGELCGEILAKKAADKGCLFALVTVEA